MTPDATGSTAGLFVTGVGPPIRLVLIELDSMHVSGSTPFVGTSVYPEGQTPGLVGFTVIGRPPEFTGVVGTVGAPELED
jgi:hypothetical protein